jgi:hypothetical protein
MNRYVTLLAALVLSQPVHASDARDMLVVAKYAGFCGAIIGIYNFQQATKMAGGDEFVARFIATEAARLGTTVEKIVANCQASIKSYDEIMAMPLGK